VSMVDLRCAKDPRRLFAKMKLNGERPAYIDTEGDAPRNLIEFSCQDCLKAERREDPELVKVYHRFDFIGQPVETVREYADGHEAVRSDLERKRRVTPDG
jgi:hypothetical protein